MRRYTVPLFGMLAVLAGASLVLANPSMLPTHPGYPMKKAMDPVTGQSLANDPGQPNATGEKALEEAAAYDDQHVTQELTFTNDKRILEKPGANVLPKVEGPDIKIEPPVKEGTRMQ